MFFFFLIFIFYILSFIPLVILWVIRGANPLGYPKDVRVASLLPVGLIPLSLLFVAPHAAAIDKIAIAAGNASGLQLIEKERHFLDARRAEQVVIPTFGAFADELVETLRTGFKNERHGWQWKHNLEVYGAPLRAVQLDKVTTEDVLGVLQPLWQTKQETASVPATGKCHGVSRQGERGRLPLRPLQYTPRRPPGVDVCCNVPSGSAYHGPPGAAYRAGTSPIWSLAPVASA